MTTLDAGARLRKVPECPTWCVDYSQTTRRDEIIDLFGSALVPTPYSVRVPGALVLEHIGAVSA